MSEKDDRPYVVAIGPNDIDIYYRCREPLINGSKCVVEKLSESPGGFIANAAVVMSALGTRTYLFDSLGEDAYTKLIVDSLAEKGIDTGYLDILPGEENIRVDILLSEGERTCLIHKNTKPFITMNREKEELLKGSAYLYSTFSSLKKLDGYRELVLRLKKDGVRFMFDAERTTFRSLDAPEDAFLFEIADILSINDTAQEHLLQTSGEDALERLLRMGDRDKTLLLTLGGKGAVVKTGQGEFAIPACPVEPVDTTGAGDTFNGAYLHAVMKGMTAEEAGRFAAAAAGRSIQFMGSRAGAVTEREVREFMKSLSL